MSTPALGSDPRTRSGSPRTRWLFPVLAIALGVCLSLVVGEGAVRLASPLGSELPRSGLQADWRPGMEPGETGVTRLEEAGKTLEVPFRIHSGGFRDRERSHLAAPGTRRAAVLGDSFVAGFAVAQEEIFPARTEQVLGSRWETPVEVLAFGTVGQGTGLELLTLEQRVLAYSPQLVILAFFQNDPWDNFAGLGSQRAPYFRLLPSGELELLSPHQAGVDERGGFSRWLNGSSRLYRLQKHLVSQIVDGWKYRQRHGVEALPKVYRPLVDPPIEGLDAAWELTLALVGRMRDRCQERGMGFMVMDIPMQEEVSPSRRALSQERFPALGEVRMQWDRSVRRLGEYCARSAIPYLDLRLSLRGPEGDGARFYLAADGHFTAQGHMQVATALADFVVSQRLLPGGP